MRLDGLSRGIAWSAFLSVCVMPFLFGAVERSIWIPLCELWLVLGTTASLTESRQASAGNSPGPAVAWAVLPIHAFFLIQLIPLPASILHAISPGSFAAHFLPDPGDGRFRPVSVSPAATVEAWLYFAGLQGLFLALQGLPHRLRPAVARALLGVIVALAAEGLWQSRTDHPTWLYSRIPILAPPGLDNASFGPYFNRNHFATAMALGAGWAAGLAMALTRERRGFRRLLTNPSAMAQGVLMGGAALLLLTASAASGSRSGTAAAIAAIAATLGVSGGARRLLLPLGLAIVGLALAGPAVLDRLMHLDIVTSRWAPWMDMSRLVRFFPALGSGLGTFHAAYWPYQMNATYEYWRHAHNEYLQGLIEAGFLGLAVAAFVLFRLRRTVTLDHTAREAVLGAATALACQAALDFPLRIPANAALFVCMMALSTTRRES
ncbi:MAG: O-antigen ligase family protein [Vicinamibacteria bacterium]